MNSRYSQSFSLLLLLVFSSSSMVLAKAPVNKKAPPHKKATEHKVDKKEEAKHPGKVGILRSKKIPRDGFYVQDGMTCRKSICVTNDVTRGQLNSLSSYVSKSALPASAKIADQILAKAAVQAPDGKTKVPGVKDMSELGERKIRGKRNPYYRGFWKLLNANSLNSKKSLKFDQVAVDETDALEKLKSLAVSASANKTNYPMIGIGEFDSDGNPNGVGHFLSVNEVSQKENGDIHFQVFDSNDSQKDERSFGEIKFNAQEGLYYSKHLDGTWGAFASEFWIGDARYYFPILP